MIILVSITVIFINTYVLSQRNFSLVSDNVLDRNFRKGEQIYNRNQTKLFFPQPLVQRSLLPDLGCEIDDKCSDDTIPYKAISGEGTDKYPIICFNNKLLIHKTLKDTKIGRGLNVAVVDSKTYDVKFIENFDTYLEETFFLRFLRLKLNDGDIAIIASHDEMTYGLKDASLTLLENYGSQTIKGVKYRDSYVMIGQKGLARGKAIEMHQSKGRSDFGSAAQISGCAKFPLGQITPLSFPTLEVNKEGKIAVGTIIKNCGLTATCKENEFAAHVYTGKDNNDEPKICVDGKYVIAKGINDAGRGLNVVVVSNGKEVIRTGHFDTWKDDSTNLEIFLENLEDNVIIIVVSFDEASLKLSQHSKTLFFDLGSATIQNLKYRDVWVFVGQKGIQGFSPYEEISYAGFGSTYAPLIDKRMCVPQAYGSTIYQTSGFADNFEPEQQRHEPFQVPKLRCFILKTFITNDAGFSYLKWLLNNLNHIQKLKLYLAGEKSRRENQSIWKYLIDANFVRQYCLPDLITNLVDFDFYISSYSEILSIDVEKVINSFKSDPFFISRQWTNVTYFYDPIISYQHLFSMNVNVQLQVFNGLINYPYIFQWPNIRQIRIHIHPSLYFFLEKFDKVFPNVSTITVVMEKSVINNESDHTLSFTKPFEIDPNKMTNIQFRNVTKLKFGHIFMRLTYACDESMDRNRERAKLLAHLISMPVQLKYLLVRNFQWFLHVVEYASDQLKKDALNNVRYAEFGIPSCNCGSNQSIYIGKHLVTFLKIYMPDLQTLRLWRPDDFPWTTTRPDLPEVRHRMTLIARWMKYLHTPESIAQHVIVFEKDLCQLIEQLKEFVFLDIYGSIPFEKVAAYQSMVETRFPNGRSYVSQSRFCLWL
ncbi:unnamed protein product [Rotaria magnacalcarata]